MSAFLHDVARASLPVAVALLIFTAGARAALAPQVDDPDIARLARQYVEPLSTWCLVAVAAHVLALGAAGDAGVLSIALALGLGAAAMLLRPAGEALRPADDEPLEQPNPPGGESVLRSITKVEAAVLAKSAGATIERTETDGDSGAPYESHIKTSAGKELEVHVSKDFKVVDAAEHPAHP